MVATRKRKYGDDAPTLAEHRVMDGSILQVLECVLSQLAAVDVCRLCAVCKAWDTVAKTNHVWKSICEREGVHLQEEMQANSDDGRCYKLVYTFRKKLLTPAGQDINGNCLVVSLSSRHIFATKVPDWDNDHNIHVFTTGNGEYSHQLVGLLQHPEVLVVSQDGSKVVAYAGTTVAVWNVNSAQCIHSLDHPANIGRMVVHNQMVAVSLEASFSPNVFVWSIESGQLLHRLAGLNRTGAMAMDDQHIVLHHWDSLRLGIVQLWDVNSGAHLYTWTGTEPFQKLLLDNATRSLVCLKCKYLSVWDTGTGLRRTSIDAARNVYYTGMMIHCANWS